MRDEQDKLDNLYSRLRKLLDQETYHKVSLVTIGRETATLRAKIADIIDKRQGVLPL